MLSLNLSAKEFILHSRTWLKYRSSRKHSPPLQPLSVPLLHPTAPCLLPHGTFHNCNSIIQCAICCTKSVYPQMASFRRSFPSCAHNTRQSVLPSERALSILTHTLIPQSTISDLLLSHFPILSA